MSYRPYFQRHPAQRRVFAAFLLITLPIWVGPLALWLAWDDVLDFFEATIRELVSVIRE